MNDPLVNYIKKWSPGSPNNVFLYAISPLKYMFYLHLSVTHGKMKKKNSGNEELIDSTISWIFTFVNNITKLSFSH